MERKRQRKREREREAGVWGWRQRFSSRQYICERSSAVCSSGYLSVISNGYNSSGSKSSSPSCLSAADLNGEGPVLWANMVVQLCLSHKLISLGYGSQTTGPEADSSCCSLFLWPTPTLLFHLSFIAEWFNSAEQSSEWRWANINICGTKTLHQYECA